MSTVWAIVQYRLPFPFLSEKMEIQTGMAILAICMVFAFAMFVAAVVNPGTGGVTPSKDAEEATSMGLSGLTWLVVGIVGLWLGPWLIVLGVLAVGYITYPRRG